MEILIATQYFVKNKKVHKYPVPNSCHVKYENQKLYDSDTEAMKHADEKCDKCEFDSKVIPFPLPDDEKGKAIATTITDEEGKYQFNLRSLKPGRYTFTVVYEGNEKYKPVEASTVITITPDVSTKKAIKEYNKILRFSIISSNNIFKIKECVEWSRTALELCSKKLKKCALKEFEKTAKKANRRINDLRTIEKEWGLGAQIGRERLGLDVKKKTKKK